VLVDDLVAEGAEGIGESKEKGFFNLNFKQ